MENLLKKLFGQSEELGMEKVIDLLTGDEGGLTTDILKGVTSLLGDANKEPQLPEITKVVTETEKSDDFGFIKDLVAGLFKQVMGSDSLKKMIIPLMPQITKLLFSK